MSYYRKFLICTRFRSNCQLRLRGLYRDKTDFAAFHITVARCKQLWRALKLTRTEMSKVKIWGLIIVSTRSKLKQWQYCGRAIRAVQIFTGLQLCLYIKQNIISQSTYKQMIFNTISKVISITFLYQHFFGKRLLILMLRIKLNIDEI